MAWEELGVLVQDKKGGQFSMTLAPIRGAPPGAPVPDFPIEEPRAQPEEPAATPDPSDRRPMAPIRRSHTPIEIGGYGIVLTFKVIPELPAIARASMTVHIVADAVGRSSSDTLGFLRMSAENARAFLCDLRNGCSPIVAMGDEDGTVQIELETMEAASIVSVREPGQLHILHRWVFDQRLDLQTMANELLTDLGA
jgi:hypothetical protein